MRQQQQHTTYQTTLRCTDEHLSATFQILQRTHFYFLFYGRVAQVGVFDPEAFDEDEVGLLFNEVGTNGRVHGHCCRHSQRAAILGPATAAADTLNVLQSNRRCGEGREGARRLRSLPRPVGGHGPVRVARQGRGRRAVPEAREKGACTPPPIWQAFQSDSGEGVAQRLKRRCIGIGSSPNEAGQRLCSRPLLLTLSTCCHPGLGHCCSSPATSSITPWPTWTKTGAARCLRSNSGPSGARTP